MVFTPGQGPLGRQRIELLLCGLQLCCSIGSFSEQSDRDLEVLACFFGLAGGSIQAPNAQLGDGKLRLNCQRLEVMGFGFGEMAQRLLGCAHCEVNVMHLIGDRLEVQGELVVLDRGPQFLSRGINKPAVVVCLGVSSAGNSQGTLQPRAC